MDSGVSENEKVMGPNSSRTDLFQISVTPPLTPQMLLRQITTRHDQPVDNVSLDGGHIFLYRQIFAQEELNQKKEEDVLEIRKT